MTGKVITTLVIAEKNAKPDVPQAPMVGRAGSFTYTDQTRRAVYKTRRRWWAARATCAPTRIEMVLAPAGEHARAARGDGHGHRHRRQARRHRREAVVPSRPTTRYVVLGAPVKMIDADCQETTGKTLTFFKSSDRVVVDGNEEIRTQAKSGGKCPSAPPK